MSKHQIKEGTRFWFKDPDRVWRKIHIKASAKTFCKRVRKLREATKRPELIIVKLEPGSSMIHVQEDSTECEKTIAKGFEVGVPQRCLVDLSTDA